MKNWKTTLCGILAALSTSIASIPGLPDNVKLGASLVLAASLGALGYHATDCSTCPGLTVRKAAGLAAMLFALCLAGCSLASLGVNVSSPTFGSVGVTLGGGSIGRSQTNAPAPASTNAPGV